MSNAEKSAKYAKTLAGRQKNKFHYRIQICVCYEVIWKDKFVDKIEGKHKVITDEVEEVLFSKPHTRRAEKGHVRGEDLYVAYA